MLKELREKARISQIELATEAGVKQQTISNYETGRNVPNIVVAERIIKALRKRKVKASFAMLAPTTDNQE